MEPLPTVGIYSGVVPRESDQVRNVGFRLLFLDLFIVVGSANELLHDRYRTGVPAIVVGLVGAALLFHFWSSNDRRR